MKTLKLIILEYFLYYEVMFMRNFDKVTRSRIDSFSISLRQILENELSLGNEIAETSKGWPKEFSILIMLKYPFRSEYMGDKLAYRNINDPHYWKAEYCDNELNHTLACRF